MCCASAAAHHSLRASHGVEPCVLLAGVLLTSGCTPHEPPGPAPSLSQVEQPLVQEIEAEPEPEPPSIVAPALPPLKPTRPLANLELRWREGPPVETLWPVGTSVVALPDATAKALGLEGPPTTLRGSDAEAIPHAWELERAGPLLIAVEQPSVTAYEIGSGNVRWSLPPPDEGRSYLHFIGERVLVSASNLSASDELGAWALEDGRRLWLRAGEGFTRISDLATDGVRGYALSDAGIEAFELLTGKTLWTTQMSAPNCGFAVGEGVVVIEDPGGHRVLEAELGAERARLGRTKSHCMWAEYRRSQAVISGGRLYAFDGEDGGWGDPTTLYAYALDTHTEQWHAPGFDADMLAVDHDAVYLSRDGRELVVLDAASGAVAFEFGCGSEPFVDVEPVGGDAGPLAIAYDDVGTWMFARAEQPVPPESWELRGRLVSDGYLDKRRLAGVELIVDGKKVVTDKRGRFVARGQGRGVVHIENQWDESAYDTDTWSRAEIYEQQVVLDGSERYDVGEIETYEGYIE